MGMLIALFLTVPMSATTESSPMPFEQVRLEGRKLDTALIELIPGEFALNNQVLPLERIDGKMLVAIGSLASLPAVSDLEVLLQSEVEPVLADPAELKEKIEEIFLEKILSQVSGSSDADSVVDGDDVTDLADLQKMAGETAVVQMVN